MSLNFVRIKIDRFPFLFIVLVLGLIGGVVLGLSRPEGPEGGVRGGGETLAAFGCFHAGEGRILKGVSIVGVDVGGLTRAEAEERLWRFVADIVMRPVTLRYGTQAWRLDPQSLGIGALVEAAVTKAYSVGRVGSLVARLRERYRVSRSGESIPLDVVVDEEKFRIFLFGLSMEINREARDAFLVIDPDDTVRVVEARDGRWLNTANSVERVKDALFRKEGREVALDVRVIRPRIPTERIRSMGIKELLGSYETRFDPGDDDRTYNIRIGADAVDGYIIPPGKVFSFNAVVGPRSQEYGYREAPVIINSELISGIGGGVCQVSSTLYNVALLSGLEIVARANHSLAPGYVPPGRDATVAYNYIDLKIKNTTGSHILIRAWVREDRLLVKLFGDSPDNQVISVVTEVEEKTPPPVIEKEDPGLPTGERKVEDKGSSGYVVKVWRIVKVNGVEVRRELISRDRYKPKPAIVRVGTKPVETETVGPLPEGTSAIEGASDLTNQKFIR